MMIKVIIIFVGILLIKTFSMPISFESNNYNDLQRVINARNALTPFIIANGVRESVPVVDDNQQLYSLLISLLIENQRIRRSSTAMFNEEQSEMLQGLANQLSAHVRPG